MGDGVSVCVAVGGDAARPSDGAGIEAGEDAGESIHDASARVRIIPSSMRTAFLFMGALYSRNGLRAAAAGYGSSLAPSLFLRVCLISVRWERGRIAATPEGADRSSRQNPAGSPKPAETRICRGS